MSTDAQEERQSRSLALEKAYVHDVYDQIAPHFTDTRYRAWPRVKQFLLDLEPASLVADVGCGNGKYLDINREIVMVGSDRCAALTDAARNTNHEVLTCDNLQLPFRDETFDAVLSVAVIHHFATTDRRVAAIKELARVLRIGGKVLITVWAMEQRHRKFDSQDVLVPWHEPVKSSSEDRASSVEREMTSTTTSDDDVLVYHAYSHISDSEAQRNQGGSGGGGPSNVSRRRQKYRNGRERHYRSAGSFEHCGGNGTRNSSRSSSELSSPNETCYSFVKRALQKLSSSSNSPYPTSSKKSNAKPYFYRSCRKPWVSTSMEFSPNLQSNSEYTRNELHNQSSLDSECNDPANENDVPIEIRHLEGYEPCMNCGSPVRDADLLNHCETHVCASCFPIDTDSSGKKSRSLGDFLNMIPKLLRVKKCDKEPLSDLHKRISTASDPREYVEKSRGANGIVRSKSTVSFMSRLEEIMSLSVAAEKLDAETDSVRNSCSKSKNKPSRLPSMSSNLTNNDCPVIVPDSDRSTNPRRYNSPADALRKLRQDVSLDDGRFGIGDKRQSTDQGDHEKTFTRQSSETSSGKSIKTDNVQEFLKSENVVKLSNDGTDSGLEQKNRNDDDGSQESHLSSYYSMPELHKLTEEQMQSDAMFPAQRQRHISFYEQAQTILGDSESSEGLYEMRPLRSGESSDCGNRDGTAKCTPLRALVKRSLSVDTGDNSSSSHQCPRRFSASAAQGVLASALRTYSLPRSSSRGSSVKSDTSVDSEESIVSVVPRKGNSITSDTSVDSEESVISVIQRSTSEIETLVRESGLRNNISRLGSRSARASPVTVLSSQTSSAESSPPQSGKNDGKFPGSSAVIDQLMQQQQMSLYSLEGVHMRQEAGDHVQRTRRSLLRPMSDPKIEDRYFSNGLEDVPNHKTTSRQTSGSNRSSLESDDQIIKEEDEKMESVASPVIDSASSPKSYPLVLSIDASCNKKIESTGNSLDLSRTPSPIGPFKYIYDPLLTDIDPSTLGLDSKSSTNANASFGKDTDLSEAQVTTATSPDDCETNLTSSEEISEMVSECDNPTTPVDETLAEFPEDESNSHLEKETNTSQPGTSSTTDEMSDEANKEAERHEKLRKLSQRLENLGLSSELLKSFYMSSEDNEAFENDSTAATSVADTNSTLEDDGDEEVDEENSRLGDESKSDACTTVSTEKERSDDDSCIDESLKTVIQGIEEIHQAKEIEQPSPVCAKLEGDEAALKIETVNNISKPDSDVDSSNRASPSGTDKSSGSLKNFSSSSGEQKPGFRAGLKRRLKRSCVTIDEVECHEVASSEDTSPSSSVSLEWNDFDKFETAEPQPQASIDQACCSSSLSGNVRIQQEEAFPEDVNVAETENKFNVFLDKEMCVYFETPPSSIGKSASSSSNATDFSTTSDRFRGVMQREKSDDRSSKESDSDNLSKLSDLEAKSDSAFSEDFARKTELGSSSSSASFEIVDFHRPKMSSESSQSWAEGDAGSTSSREKQNWILDNIDEIPDDDKHSDLSSIQKKSDPSQWPDESSMDYAQRRENFFNCAADCRDMYRISFDDSTHRSNDLGAVACNEGDEATGGQEEVPCPPAQVPELLQQQAAKDSDDSEAPSTDILAAFVETISDLTSVFGELYPRHEGKFEDVSSDDSLEISSFERILTSQEPQPTVGDKLEKNFETKEKNLQEDKEKRLKAQKDLPLTNKIVPLTRNCSLPLSVPTSQESSGKKPKNHSDAHIMKSTLRHKELVSPKDNKPPSKQQTGPEPQNQVVSLEKDYHENCSTKPNFVKQDSSDSSGVSDAQKSCAKPKPCKKMVEDLDLSRTAKPSSGRVLNRSSQSVCTDKFRQDSLEDESSIKTHSAPCSPRMKPRQKSIEEVMSRSKAEFSRNSSLSLSTSQESLPGNESGGLMAYHRYYHVFRQGELDNLIENYVENLHIIASYYDHANWCVVAEKVQVWTI